MKKSESFYATAIPMIIYCGSMLIVLSNYCTIRLYGIVNPALYSVFPILSVSVMVFNLTVVPEATKNIHEKSVELHRHVVKLAENKYGRCTVRSLRVFGLSATFFLMKNNLRRRIIEYQLYYTVNLLLSL